MAFPLIRCAPFHFPGSDDEDTNPVAKRENSSELRMSERRAIDFEPRIEIADEPFNAARTYLAVMAYPERGAGQLGGLGVPFGTALWQYIVWHRRQAKGLRDVRALFGDGSFLPPRKRDFAGTLNRGMRRLQRRFAAFDIVGTRLLNGVLNARLQADQLVSNGGIEEAFDVRPDAKFYPIKSHILERATPTSKRIVSRNLDRWSERFGLNETGPAADPAQKGKDLVRRGFLQSRPVLHMAHGLNEIVRDVGPTLVGWDQADWLLVLLWNADAWVWRAIEHAENWRSISGLHPAMGLAPTQMIALVPPKGREIMPPTWMGSSA